MKVDQIIEAAEKVGFTRTHTGEVQLWLCNAKDLDRFAKLVAAKEREACAKVCEELSELSRISDTDSMWEWGECAAAIRARENV